MLGAGLAGCGGGWGLGAWGATGQPLSLGQQQGALEGEGEREQVVLCLELE